MAQPEFPVPSDVLTIMERAADWQLAHPDPERNPDTWHNATLYAGVMALAKISAAPRFTNEMLQIGRQQKWQFGPRGYNPDDQAVGQTWAELSLQQHDPSMIAPLQRQFDLIMAHPANGNLEYNRATNPDYKKQWTWCDALFMAPPTWIRLWKATGDHQYLDYAVEHWWHTSDYLYDHDEDLFYRDSTYFHRRESNGAKVFWSRANGWVMAGLARIIPLLPADHPSRSRFIHQFQAMAARVLACQQPDGLWRASLLDPAAYPMKESSGSAFFCFALAWGVNQELLDRDKFMPAILKAWHALSECVTADGRVTHVQPVGSTPETFNPNHTAPYGTGAFILAGSEVYRLIQP